MPKPKYVIPGRPVFRSVEHTRSVLERRGFDIRGLLPYCFYALNSRWDFSQLRSYLARDLLDVYPELCEDSAALRQLIHQCIDIIGALEAPLKQQLARYITSPASSVSFEYFLGWDIVISQDQSIYDLSHHPLSHATPTARGTLQTTGRVPYRLWHRLGVDSASLV